MSRNTVAKKVSEVVVLQSIKAKSKKPVKALQAVTKVTKANSFIVAQNLKTLDGLEKEAVKQYKEIVDPIKGSLQRIENLFEPTFTLFKELKLQGKEQINKFLAQNNARAEELDKQFEKGKIRKGTTLMQKKEELVPDLGELNTRNTTVLKCVASEKTPRNYLVPDESAIREALKQGKAVPGWKLVQETKVTF
jgi:hypothetical protein